MDLGSSRKLIHASHFPIPCSFFFREGQDLRISVCADRIPSLRGRAVGKVLKTQAEVAGNNELNVSHFHRRRRRRLFLIPLVLHVQRVPFEYCRVHQCYHFPQDEATVDGRTCCVTCETK